MHGICCAKFLRETRYITKHINRTDVRFSNLTIQISSLLEYNSVLNRWCERNKYLSCQLKISRQILNCPYQFANVYQFVGSQMSREILKDRQVYRTIILYITHVVL